MSEFGKLLRKERKCQNGGEGWSYGQLSKRVPWTDGTIARWEDGSLPPPGPDTVLTLAKALGVDPKMMLRASIGQRQEVTLEVLPERVAFCAALVIAWEGLTADTMEKITKVLHESRNG